MPVISVPKDRKQPALHAPRRRKPLKTFFVAIIAFVAFAIVIAPHWFPLPAELDDQAISLERTQRRWRTSLGLPMPGQPDVSQLSQRLADRDLSKGAPILMRIFKREFELELWMKRDGVFHRFATYPICRWSGALGPKLSKATTKHLKDSIQSMRLHLIQTALGIAHSILATPTHTIPPHGRTGSLIMVHGGCASVGCFAMTNSQMGEIWELVTAALSGGQKRFQVQVYPFRMTDERLKAYASHPANAFWRTLKQGHDLFEESLLPPRVNVCKGAYGFEPSGLYPNGDGGIEIRCSSAGAKS